MPSIVVGGGWGGGNGEGKPMYCGGETTTVDGGDGGSWRREDKERGEGDVGFDFGLIFWF